MTKTYRPPADVARAAREGMELRASLSPSKQCCTPVGVRRGVQLSNREPVSLDTIKRMYSYFRRHEVDSKGKGWGVDSKGWQAWLLWGGWEGYEWVAGILGKTMNPSPLDEYLDGFFDRHPKLSRYRSRIRFSDKEKGASPGHGEARQYADEIWVFPKFWKLGDVGVQDFVMAHEIGHWVLSQHGLAEAIREAYSLGIDPWDTFNLPFGQFNMDEAFSDSFASYYTDGDVKSRYPKWTRLVEVVQQRANPAKVGPKRAEAIAEGFKYVALKGNKIVAYADTKAEAQSVGTPEKLPTIPARYLKGLNKKDKVKRVLEIFKERESPTYKPLPSDKGVKTKRSGWAGKFERKYGRPGKNVADVAKLTGIKKSILDEVYRKGLAAWSTGGHRPGASQHAWALARVYSFVLGGPTATGPDRYLAVRAGLLKNPQQIPAGFLEGSLYKDPLFHASDYLLKEGEQLDPSWGGEYGIYLSPSRRYARGYGKHLYTVLANIKAPLYVEGKYEISPKDLTKEDVKKLQQLGYDSVVVTNSTIENASEIVLFDPTQIHIIEIRKNPLETDYDQRDDAVRQWAESRGLKVGRTQSSGSSDYYEIHVPVRDRSYPFWTPMATVGLRISDHPNLSRARVSSGNDIEIDVNVAPGVYTWEMGQREILRLLKKRLVEEEEEAEWDDDYYPGWSAASAEWRKKNPASPDDPPGIAYVKDLAYKLETERGLNPGAAMGIAWSIACKYKRDDIPELDDHCKRPPEDYL